MTKPNPGQPAPQLSVPLVGGGSFDLLAHRPKTFTLVLFYRGYHCPLCKGYLGKAEALLPAFEAEGVDVVAVSMNDAETAGKTKAEWELPNLRIGYGLTEQAARDWGLYISNAIREGELPVFNEPGLFLVKPDGTLYMVSIGSMPFGRPDLEEMLQRVRFVTEKGYPPRGDRVAA